MLNVKERLVDADSVLAVLKDIIHNNSKALNLRNLQVFRSLLLNLQRKGKSTGKCWIVRNANWKDCAAA
ncbi:hypothetical protein [Paraflavitalea speifideaquila]|uniref:hypothetical protein n=1 Tax=Paraflavitalea speifideaquila TaxID=3076558 RepID=UPI0028E65821|nr:hypothetical protein [Paraflavitalea speifideiaquila]